MKFSEKHLRTDPPSPETEPETDSQGNGTNPPAGSPKPPRPEEGE